MKRLLCVILALLMIFSFFPANTYAAETGSTGDVFYMDDGSYIITYIEELGMRASNSKTGSRVFEYYNNNHEIQWRATLTGTYLYTGTTATCTGSKCDVVIYNSAWYVISKSSGMLGAKATAELSVGRKVLGVTVERKNVSMALSCDPNGNLS